MESQMIADVLELARMEDDPASRVTFHVGPYTAFALIGALQLATRHPGMSALLRDHVQQGIDQMIAAFEGHPAHRILLMGNDPSLDVDR